MLANKVIHILMWLLKSDIIQMKTPSLTEHAEYGNNQSMSTEIHVERITIRGYIAVCLIKVSHNRTLCVQHGRGGL